MTRPDAMETESGGAFSLVGVGTSVAGVLLVLATIVADRIWQSASAAIGVSVDMAATRQTEETLESEVNRLVAQINTVRAEAAARRFERDRLATMLTAAEAELAARRNALADDDDKQVELDRELAQAQAELDRLEKQRKTALEKPDKTVKVENFPTPLSKPVDTKEIHFQLKHGRLAYVPMNEFMSQVQELFREKSWKLKDSNEITETYGPVDGFTVRYTMVREEVSWEEAVRKGERGGGTIVALDRCEFLPSSSQLGEPVQDALSSRSAFRGRLDDLNPKRTTVTVWVYPDSFADFRFIRKQLYDRGFTVAARPKSDETFIGGSRNGSKSAAE